MMLDRSTPDLVAGHSVNENPGRPALEYWGEENVFDRNLHDFRNEAGSLVWLIRRV